MESYDPAKTDYLRIGKKIIEKVRRDLKKSFTGLVLTEGPLEQDGKSVARIVGKNFDAMMLEAVLDVRDTTQTTLDDALTSVDTNEALGFFERKITKLRKYSIGNCHEYADLVLDEIWRFSQKKGVEIRAELFGIKNGDHTFVVIGRDPEDSDVGNPETWGNAVIIDAWAGKSYYAKEYQDKLRNYVFTTEKMPLVDFSIRYQPGLFTTEHKHYTEKFNPVKHKLQPFIMNTDILRKRLDPNYVGEMNQVFMNKVEICQKALKAYQDQLQRILNFIAEKYGNNSEKYQILDEKITAIKQLLMGKFNPTDIAGCRINDYKDKHLLEKKLSDLLKEIFLTARYTTEQTKILNTPADTGTAKFMKFVFTDTKEMADIKLAFDALSMGLAKDLSSPNSKRIVKKQPLSISRRRIAD